MTATLTKIAEFKGWNLRDAWHPEDYVHPPFRKVKLPK